MPTAGLPVKADQLRSLCSALGAMALVAACSLIGCGKATSVAPTADAAACASQLQAWGIVLAPEPFGELEVGATVPCVLAPAQPVSPVCAAQIGEIEWESTVPGIVSFGPPTDDPAFGDPRLGVTLTGEAVGTTHVLARLSLPGGGIVTARRINDQPVVVVPATDG